MDKYLKMADVFPVEIRTDDESGSLICDDDGIILESFSGDKVADYTLHAINSHDELVENALHYEADALMWERRAVTEASRAQELVAEVERLRESLRWAVGNLPFENAFEWSDDENADSHYAALRLLGVDIEE